MTDKTSGGFAGFDFSSAQVTNESLAELPLPMLPGAPVLLVAPATEANKSYFEARLKISNRMKRAMGPNTEITAGAISTNRDQDRKLYGQFIVRGWPKPPVDTKGQPVEFSRDRAIELINAIPDWVFDDISAFCREPANFLDQPIDSDGIAGN